LTATPRYPGVRCDVPSHCYQYTFESNTQWSEYYSEGKEIEKYFQRVAKKFGVYKYIKFKHMLTGANWDKEAGKWHVKLQDLTTGRVQIPQSILTHVPVWADCF
jgi:cation diffusion facilitator CzcD-associated flavoprotein CzcO